MFERRFPLSTYLAVGGAVVGLAGALFLGGLRVANSEGPQLRAEWAGNLVFTLVYLTPFVLSLLALRWSAVWQAAVWGAATVLAGLGIFTSFSGVSLVLVPAALLLGPAALVAFGRAAPSRWPVALLVAGVLVALVAGGWLGLNIVDDGRCWELVRDATGDTTWQSAPYGQRGTVTATTGGEEPGVVRVLCSSDVITGTEAVFALLPLLMTALLVTWLARWQN